MSFCVVSFCVIQMTRVLCHLNDTNDTILDSLIGGLSNFRKNRSNHLSEKKNKIVTFIDLDMPLGAYQIFKKTCENILVKKNKIVTFLDGHV